MYTPGLDFLRVFMGAIYAGKIFIQSSREVNSASEFWHFALTRVIFRCHCGHSHATIAE